MSEHTDADQLSEGLANAVASAAPCVVQVAGRGRPVSGTIHSAGVVLTNARALGREDGLNVRDHAGATRDAELVGWDPPTGLAVLRVDGLDGPGLQPSHTEVRVGHLAVGVARSWSNGITASAGMITAIGGPLATGRRQSVERVIRVAAPMHDGFAGGALINTRGECLGVTTAAAIRGSRVVIPAAIAWKAASEVLAHGRRRRGYLGIAGLPAQLAAAQQTAGGRDTALLVVGVTPASPAQSAGVLVGDVLLDFDGHAVQAPDDLLHLLDGERIGRSVPLHLLRGVNDVTLDVQVGERAAQ